MGNSKSSSADPEGKKPRAGQHLHKMKVKLSSHPEKYDGSTGAPTRKLNDVAMEQDLQAVRAEYAATKPREREQAPGAEAAAAAE